MFEKLQTGEKLDLAQSDDNKVNAREIGSHSTFFCRV